MCVPNRQEANLNVLEHISTNQRLKISKRIYFIVLTCKILQLNGQSRRWSSGSCTIVIETVDYLDDMTGTHLVLFCHCKQENLARLQVVNKFNKPKLLRNIHDCLLILLPDRASQMMTGLHHQQ